MFGGLEFTVYDAILQGLIDDCKKFVDVLVKLFSILPPWVNMLWGIGATTLIVGIILKTLREV